MPPPVRGEPVEPYERKNKFRIIKHKLFYIKHSTNLTINNIRINFLYFLLITISLTVRMVRLAHHERIDECMLREDIFCYFLYRVRVILIYTWLLIGRRFSCVSLFGTIWFLTIWWEFGMKKVIGALVGICLWVSLCRGMVDDRMQIGQEAERNPDDILLAKIYQTMTWDDLNKIKTDSTDPVSSAVKDAFNLQIRRVVLYEEQAAKDDCAQLSAGFGRLSVQDLNSRASQAHKWWTEYVQKVNEMRKRGVDENLIDLVRDAANEGFSEVRQQCVDLINAKKKQ